MKSNTKHFFKSLLVIIFILNLLSCEKVKQEIGAAVGALLGGGVGAVVGALISGTTASIEAGNGNIDPLF